MRPGGSREKGHEAEREVIKLLEPVTARFGVKLMRNLLQTRQGGHDVEGLKHVAIEVKRQEVLEIEKWWQQALEQASRVGAIPVLVFRQSRKPWRVMMWGQVGEGEDAVRERVEIGVGEFKRWLTKSLVVRGFKEGEGG